MAPAPLDGDEFHRQGRLVVDLIADYYARIDDYPVRPAAARPGFLARQLPETAPEEPEPEAFAAALRDVRDLILPGVTHWQSPRHFAHFAATASNAGALGEALAAGLNINPFTWAASPAATELEVVVTGWLGRALHLPETLLFSGGGGGTLLGTSCEAMLCAVVAARDRKLAEVGEERIGDLVVYCSDQAHFSFRKAARVAGIRRGNIREIPTSREDGCFALRPRALLAAVRADEAAGRVPLLLCATVGTTATAAVDPVGELCAAVSGRGVWVHVDAAWAGAAWVCPEFAHVLAGAEGVDSLSTNPHKWMMANMDCCALWVRRPDALVAALGADNDDVILKDPSCMESSEEVVDYKDWQVALSRRFRALKLWLVLRCHGLEGLRGFVRGHVRMAAAFEAMVRADRRFEVPVPRSFALVCFRLRPNQKHPRRDYGDEDVDNNHKATNELNKRLLEAVNATGRAYMSCAVAGGVYMLRCAIGNSLTEDRHVREAWAVVQDQATAILRHLDDASDMRTHCAADVVGANNKLQVPAASLVPVENRVPT